MPPKYTFTSPPILLLKTKSSPQDSYEEYFTAHDYDPAFIPVLEHHFNKENLTSIRELFESGGLLPGPERKYGGLIFTSQRAVEGFAELVGGLDQKITHPSSQNLPLYTVGPATARSLTTLRDAHLPHATIHGADTGTGENLARYMLDHYNARHPASGFSRTASASASEGATTGTDKPPLLFLVGEQRRDVIPRMLMTEAPAEQRIEVEERVVYETGVMEGFEADFTAAVEAGEEYLQGGVDAEGKGRVVWVVVFSPTGCEAMLRVLQKRQGLGKERIFVATIGPTTRDHLVKKFGFEPQVCAPKPSQEGVARGIEEFMAGL